MEEIRCLRQTVRRLSKHIGIEFRIDKCEILTMRRGQKVNRECFQLPDGHALQ